MSQLYGENEQNHGDGGHVAKYECRPHSCFQDPDPESVVNSSPHYFDSAGADGSCTEYSLKLFGFDQVAHLRWFGGSEGRGEWASIEQALNPTSRSELAIHTCRDDGTGATAQSLAIGRPGEIVKFMGRGDVVGPLNTVGEFSVDSLINSTVVMTPVATSQCVFSTIGGKFPGDAEYVRIERVNLAGVERWQLAAHHLSGGGVFASARCFPLIQNPEQ
jgi:hypothetical protein